MTINKDLILFYVKTWRFTINGNQLNILALSQTFFKNK
jgi:hypothetical protein